MKKFKTPLEWMVNGETGQSSITIMCVMVGLKRSGDCWSCIPRDPSDFGRCYKLLKHFPEWRGRLQEVADRYPEWQLLVDNWAKLEKLYKKKLKNGTGRAPELYCLMQNLRIKT